MRPHIPTKNGPSDIDESSDTYDTIDWLVKNVPDNNGKVGHVGHLVSRLLRARGHDRRAPGAEGGVAAGAGHRLVHRRRLPPQRRVPPAARLQLLRARLRPAPRAAERAKQSRCRSTTARPTATTSSCRWARSRTSNTKYFKGDDRVLERAAWSTATTTSSGRPRDLRPHLKNIKPAVLTVGGWFDAEDLFGAAARRTSTIEANEPRRDEHARDGAVDPRRLDARRRATRSGDVRFDVEDGGVLPRADRVPVLRASPQGEGAP